METDGRKTILRSARLLDVDESRLISPGSVLIEGERITTVGVADPPGDAEIVELGDLTLLPGLMDMEVNLLLGGPGGRMAAVQFDPARRTTRIAAGTLEAGTVAAQRTTVSGMRRGKALMSFTATWYCTTDIDASWDLRPNWLACPGRGRHAAGRPHPLSGAGRALGCGLSWLYGAPRGQRHSLRLCCAAGDSHYDRSSADHRRPEQDLIEERG